MSPLHSNKARSLMYVPHPRIRRLSKIPLVGTAALAALVATSVACFTATPQVAQAADAPAITDMTEQDYQALGLGTSEDIPADTVGPYSTDTPTTFATRSEVYMAANGSHGNRYTLRASSRTSSAVTLAAAANSPMAMEVCGAPQSSGKTSTTSIRTAISTSIATTVAAPGRT